MVLIFLYTYPLFRPHSRAIRLFWSRESQSGRREAAFKNLRQYQHGQDS